MRDRNIPPNCPSCGGSLLVTRMECPDCEAEVTGSFDQCPVCRLEPDTKRLFELFMAARGNVKEVQRALGVSYPTVRQRIDGMFNQLGYDEKPPDAKSILAAVRAGELSVDEAERMLRGD